MANREASVPHVDLILFLSWARPTALLSPPLLSWAASLEAELRGLCTPSRALGLGLGLGPLRSLFLLNPEPQLQLKSLYRQAGSASGTAHSPGCLQGLHSTPQLPSPYSNFLNAALKARHQVSYPTGHQAVDNYFAVTQMHEGGSEWEGNHAARTRARS